MWKAQPKQKAADRSLCLRLFLSCVDTHFVEVVEAPRQLQISGEHGMTGVTADAGGVDIFAALDQFSELIGAG